jgi:sodium/potassium-transporting ATPase subunit alpha
MVVAIENGRLVFNNLRKVILYLLPAGSFSEVVPILLNIYLGVPMPLSAFQMICICVLTDMGPSLAMMLEKSEGDLLNKPPRIIGKDHLVDKKLLLFSYIFLGVFESFFSILMFFLYLYMYGGLLPSQVFLAFNNWTGGYLGFTQAQLNELWYTGQTVTFAALVVIQTFGNVFITRTHYLSLFQSLPILKKHRNLWIFLAQASSILFLMLIIYIPFFNNVFHTRPIPVAFYFIPIGFCVVFIALDELRKLLVRKNVAIFSKTAW